MWTGHWGPSFILKILTPEVPLGLLFFVASLPDFIMLLCVFTGMGETMTLANFLPGTFRYINDVPFTHSLLGNLILALIVASAYYLYSKSRLGATSLFLATISHWPLEILEHRKDLRVFPKDQPSIGMSYFDSYLFTFLLEGIIIGSAYYYYASNTAPVPKIKRQSEKWTQYLGILLAVEHVLFTLGIVPTENVRFVHAPMFLGQLAMTAGMAQAVDLTRHVTSSFWTKTENLKRNLNTAKYMPTGKPVR